MIALLAFAILAPTHVIEFPDPQAIRISIQALVKLPDLGAIDLAKLDVIAQTIPKQTQEYPHREMLMVTDGEPVRCNVTPDHLRIVVNVPAGKLKPGLSLMESLVHSATLTQENLDASALDLPLPDYWSAALNPVVRPTYKLTAADAQILYQRVFRPDRILLAVGGKFTAGEAESTWERRLASWNPPAEPKGYFDISMTQQMVKNPGTVTTTDLTAVPIAAGDAALPNRILALFALGTGKGASLFRVVREKNGWSYRQEAILSPTKDGWLPRLLIASIPSDDSKQRAETIRSELLEDVASWTEASRGRAIGMAEAVLSYQVPFSPLYVLGTSPVGNSLEDRTFLGAYWEMKTGNPWNPQDLLESMKRVPLADLKDQATAMLTTAIPRILTGS